MMKKLFKNQEFQLDEILFQGRNKEYGAYVLRHEADQILTKSMFIGVGLFAAIALTPLIISALNQETTSIVPEGSAPTWVDPPVIEVPDVKPPVIVPPKQVETIDTRVPTPKANPVNERKEVVTVKDYDRAVAGTETIKGDPPTVTYQQPTVGTGENTTPNVIVPKPEPTINPDEIVKNVDVEASFTGGIDSFRNKVINNFDTSSFEGSGDILKTTVTFIVERDGTITNIKANGSDASFNREAEKTIKSVKGKWVPAKVKGQAVRSYFKFPVSMKFE